VTDGQRRIETAVAEATTLQSVLGRRDSIQVQSEEEKQLIKATAHAWFNNHRPIIVTLVGDDHIKDIDGLYRDLISSAGRGTVRSKYVASLKLLKKHLGKLQAEHVIALAAPPASAQAVTPDIAPKFDPLITDPKMQAILTRRWQECGICVNSGAPLAATVMMGGLLEGLLLAKINQLSNKAPVFSAAATPVDSKTGKALQLKEWGLKNYIDVAHELGWITKTTKDIGEVVRDYRNYIHPQKELSHGIALESGDARMLWEVAKSITLQLLK
jgi:hypothetical protein